MQALNRTQPILPMAPGVPARHSHDYERNGVASLFAPMNTQTGETISACPATPPSGVPQISRTYRPAVPQEMNVHIVIDNYGTHKSAEGPELVWASPTI
jgi:hypothetical protein